MFLYHGSNVCVKFPQVLQSDRKLDFGVGFYLTSDFAQAQRWAELQVKRRGMGSSIVSVFEVDEDAFNTLRILRFMAPDLSWLNFVSENRRQVIRNTEYDIVVGPVANDNTMPVLTLFFSGILNEAETIERLLPQSLTDQYVFKTVEAIQILNFKEEMTHG